MTERPLSVLIAAPDPRVPGGVSAFAGTLKANLRRSRVHSFWVGSLEERRETKSSTLYRLLAAPLALLRAVRRERIDVVHLNPSLDWKSLIRDCLLLIALRAAGFRSVLVYFHGWRPDLERTLRRTPGLRHLFVSLLNGAGRVLVLAPQFKTALEQMGVRPEQVELTYTLYDAATITPSPLPADGGGTVTFISRFEREKGTFELVEGFARVAAEFPGTDLVFVGDGADLPLLRERARELGVAERVHFPGYVSEEVKAELLANTLIFALPTYYAEGMPRALVEAMGAGKPLLTANIGGIGAVVRDGENGVVLKQVTPETVAEGLRRLLGDRPALEAIGRHNASYARRFGGDRVAADIEALYGEIADTSARNRG